MAPIKLNKGQSKRSVKISNKQIIRESDSDSDDPTYNEHERQKNKKGSGKSARRPRKLTDQRNEKITEFMGMCFRNPKKYGEVGSINWTRGLIAHLNESQIISTGDIKSWLRDRPELFTKGRNTRQAAAFGGNSLPKVLVSSSDTEEESDAGLAGGETMEQEIQQENHTDDDDARTETLEMNTEIMNGVVHGENNTEVMEEEVESLNIFEENIEQIEVKNEDEDTKTTKSTVENNQQEVNMASVDDDDLDEEAGVGRFELRVRNQQTEVPTTSAFLPVVPTEPVAGTSADAGFQSGLQLPDVSVFQFPFSLREPLAPSNSMPQNQHQTKVSSDNQYASNSNGSDGRSIFNQDEQLQHVLPVRPRLATFSPSTTSMLHSIWNRIESLPPTHSVPLNLTGHQGQQQQQHFHRGGQQPTPAVGTGNAIGNLPYTNARGPARYCREQRNNGPESGIYQTLRNRLDAMIRGITESRIQVTASPNLFVSSTLDYCENLAVLLDNFVERLQ